MVITVVTWELSIPGCSSLKEKRMVVRSLKDRMRNKFNVSVAETGHQDVLTRAELSVALVATDQRFADSVIDKVDRLVDTDRRALIIHTSRIDH
ncbi:MAG: DUF503 domain-containing protein [Gemmatimonadetes bacterium]|nr:DUF503 domain-containing protein [Gemmatimonadota bacterium]